MPEASDPPRWFIGGFAATLLIVAGWLVSHLYSSPAAVGCQELYARAVTSEETLAVDRRTPPNDELLSGATTCVQVRLKAHASQALVGAERLLAHAIAATGGEAALAALPALEWSGSATVHVAGRDYDVLGTWLIAPPDTERVTTWLAERDSSTASTLLLAGREGSIVANGKTILFPRDQLVQEQQQAYIYSLLRLLPLKEPGVTLTLVLADSTGEPGILVHREGRLDVELYFGDDQRVRRMRTRIAALPGSTSDDEEVRLEGTAEIAGVHWFRQMHLLRNGKPYFDLVVIDGRLATSRPADWIPKGSR